MDRGHDPDSSCRPCRRAAAAAVAAARCGASSADRGAPPGYRWCESSPCRSPGESTRRSWLHVDSAATARDPRPAGRVAVASAVPHAGGDLGPRVMAGTALRTASTSPHGVPSGASAARPRRDGTCSTPAAGDRRPRRRLRSIAAARGSPTTAEGGSGVGEGHGAGRGRQRWSGDDGRSPARAGHGRERGVWLASRAGAARRRGEDATERGSRAAAPAIGRSLRSCGRCGDPVRAARSSPMRRARCSRAVEVAARASSTARRNAASAASSSAGRR